MTDPDQIDAWWGPDGFATTTEARDIRAGGVWTFEMVGPGGENFPNRVVYDEVERPERLADTRGSPADPEQFQVTMTFEEPGEDRTELTMTMRFPSSVALDDAVNFGVDDGAKQTLAKLAAHLAGGDEPVNDRYRDVGEE